MSTRTNLSGTIAAGGVAQDIQASGQILTGFSFQNVGTVDMWLGINVGDAVASQPCILVPVGALYETPTHERVTGKISVFCATTGQAFTAWSW